jgi:hypothetical protein
MKFMSEKKADELENLFNSGYNRNSQSSVYTNKNTYNTFEENPILKLVYKGFDPVIVDQNIFRVNLENIEQRIHVDYIKEYDVNVVYVDDVYLYPLAVRNYIEKTPHSNSRSINPETSYPGLTSIGKQYVPGPQLTFLIEELIERYLLDAYLKNKEDDDNLYLKKWRDFGKLEIDSAIYRRKNISVENSISTIHTDSIVESISPKQYTQSATVAGLIYMNTPMECSGGTSIYSEKGENELYSFDMKFNRLILYPSFLYHSANTSDEDSWDENWRIIQRIFYIFESREFIYQFLKNSTHSGREEKIL